MLDDISTDASLVVGSSSQLYDITPTEHLLPGVPILANALNARANS
jgi:hypothetical protein